MSLAISISIAVFCMGRELVIRVLFWRQNINTWINGSSIESFSIRSSLSSEKNKVMVSMVERQALLCEANITRSLEVTRKNTHDLIVRH